MAALWLLGVALLTVDVHCIPVNQGFNTAASSGVYTPRTSRQGLPFTNRKPPQGSPRSNVPSGAQPAPSRSVSILPGNAAPRSAFIDNQVPQNPMMPEPYFPPQPSYKAGQLSHVERSEEFGDQDILTEESPLPIPFAQETFPASISPILSGGGWDPQPPYDYRFLTGQYPPGTLSYSSNNFEHGTNYWHDVRYRRPSPPYIPPLSFPPPSLKWAI